MGVSTKAICADELLGRCSSEIFLEQFSLEKSLICECVHVLGNFQNLLKIHLVTTVLSCKNLFCKKHSECRHNIVKIKTSITVNYNNNNGQTNIVGFRSRINGVNLQKITHVRISECLLWPY